MRPVADELGELLDLTVGELVVKYEDAYGKPPRSRNAAWLRKRIAWRMQEARFGGLSKIAKSRLDALMSGIDIPRRSSAPQSVRPGTTLTREWRGRTIEVRVVEDGFECDGALFTSLTAVARAVTGAHWNGRAFFGVGPASRRAR